MKAFIASCQCFILGWSQTIGCSIGGTGKSFIWATQNGRSKRRRRLEMDCPPRVLIQEVLYCDIMLCMARASHREIREKKTYWTVARDETASKPRSSSSVAMTSLMQENRLYWGSVLQDRSILPWRMSHTMLRSCARVFMDGIAKFHVINLCRKSYNVGGGRL